MRTLIRYDLNFDKAYTYFVGQLKDGNGLSKSILKMLSFNHGTFFTLLPENSLIDQLYKFSQGGIMPSKPFGNIKYQFKNFTDFQPKQVEVIAPEFYQIIYNFLQHGGEKFAIIENVLGKISDPDIEISGVDILKCEDEIYYILKENNSLKQIKEACYKSEEVWHFLGVLGSYKEGIANLIENEGFDAIINYISFVFVGAYDGEGYVFWENADK